MQKQHTQEADSHVEGPRPYGQHSRTPGSNEETERPVVTFLPRDIWERWPSEFRSEG